MSGWAKVKDAAEYAGVSPRTFRKWLKDGLKHSRLPSGTILISIKDIDTYLRQFEADHSQVDRAVSAIMREFS
jgi:excisionase family DNA binding protein